MSTAVVMLPLVHEPGGEGGNRPTVEDVPFAVRAVDDLGGPAISFAGVDGAHLRYVRSSDGALWCPLAGPGGADVAPPAAAGAVRADWDRMALRTVPASGLGHGVLAPLKIGRRPDGSYYSCTRPQPWPARRRQPPGDRAQRLAAVSVHVGENFVVMREAVWRRCARPAVAVGVATGENGDDVAHAVFLPEGLSRHGAHAAWNAGVCADEETFVRSLSALGCMAGPIRLPVLGKREAALLDGGAEPMLHACAIDAAMRRAMEEYLPGMAVEAFGLWIAAREAMERGESGLDDYFASVKSMARRDDVGHDAPSGASRLRWGVLARGMAFAVRRHEAGYR